MQITLSRPDNGLYVTPYPTTDDTGIMYTDNDAPSAVTDLAASDITQTQATITWTNPADPDFDHVEIYASRFMEASVEIYNGSAETCVFDDLAGLLTPGTTYYLTARAYDAVGNESDAVLLEVTTLSDATSGDGLNNDLFGLSGGINAPARSWNGGIV